MGFRSTEREVGPLSVFHEFLISQQFEVQQLSTHLLCKLSQQTYTRSICILFRIDCPGTCPLTFAATCSASCATTAVVRHERFILYICPRTVCVSCLAGFACMGASCSKALAYFTPLQLQMVSRLPGRSFSLPCFNFFVWFVLAVLRDQQGVGKGWGGPLLVCLREKGGCLSVLVTRQGISKGRAHCETWWVLLGDTAAALFLSLFVIDDDATIAADDNPWFCYFVQSVIAIFDSSTTTGWRRKSEAACRWFLWSSSVSPVWSPRLTWWGSALKQHKVSKNTED